MSTSGKPSTELRSLIDRVNARCEAEIGAAQRLVMHRASSILADMSQANPDAQKAATGFVEAQINVLPPTVFTMVTLMMTQAYLIAMGVMNDDEMSADDRDAAADDLANRS